MYTSIYVQISGNMWRGKGLRVLSLLVGFAVLVVRTSQVGVGKEHGMGFAFHAHALVGEQVGLERLCYLVVFGGCHRLVKR